MDNLTMNTLYFGMTANEILSLSAKVKAAEGLVEALREAKQLIMDINGKRYEFIEEALATYDKLSEVKQ